MRQGRGGPATSLAWLTMCVYQTKTSSLKEKYSRGNSRDNRSKSSSMPCQSIHADCFALCCSYCTLATFWSHDTQCPQNREQYPRKHGEKGSGPTCQGATPAASRNMGSNRCSSRLSTNTGWPRTTSSPKLVMYLGSSLHASLQTECEELLCTAS